MEWHVLPNIFLIPHNSNVKICKKFVNANKKQKKANKFVKYEIWHTFGKIFIIKFV